MNPRGQEITNIEWLPMQPFPKNKYGRIKPLPCPVCKNKSPVVSCYGVRCRCGIGFDKFGKLGDHAYWWNKCVTGQKKGLYYLDEI